MQKVLQDIYAEAPDAVSKAISGGAWVASADDPPLDQVLGGGQMGGFVLTEYTVDPWPITVGANVKVTMRFRSTPGQPAFRTEVKIVEPDGNERTETLNSDALDAGGEATQEFSIQGALQGYYRVEIDANPDGAPQGQPPNENGSRLQMPDMGFEVASAEGGAQRQDDAALSAGIGYLSGLAAEPTWERAAASLPDAVNYLASIDGLAGDESGPLGSLGDRVPGFTEAPNVPNLTELLTNIGVAAQQQAAMSGDTTPETRAPLFAALRALDDALGVAAAPG
jgi:hypothetical protein